MHQPFEHCKSADILSCGRAKLCVREGRCSISRFDVLRSNEKVPIGSVHWKIEAVKYFSDGYNLGVNIDLVSARDRSLSVHNYNRF